METALRVVALLQLIYKISEISVKNIDISPELVRLLKVICSGVLANKHAGGSRLGEAARGKMCVPSSGPVGGLCWAHGQGPCGEREAKSPSAGVGLA